MVENLEKSWSARSSYRMKERGDVYYVKGLMSLINNVFIIGWSSFL
jgi:hypothetical protein